MAKGRSAKGQHHDTRVERAHARLRRLSVKLKLAKPPEKNRKTVCPPLPMRWLALHCASEGCSGGPSRSSERSDIVDLAGLDPVALLHDIRAASVRTAWKDGAMRPTDRPIVKAKRGRRRPAPLIRATPDLQKWFDVEPWRTGSELLSRLQVEYPGDYPNKLLRTLQRRLKSRRSEQANALLFVPTEKTSPGMRSQHPNDVPGASGGGRALRNPGHLRTRPPPKPKPGAK